MSARAGQIWKTILAFLSLGGLGGLGFGGLGLLDEGPPRPQSVMRALAQPAEAVKQAVSAPAGPAAVASKALEAAAAVTGALPPVEEGTPDWTAPGALPDRGAQARATSSYGSATCNCACEEKESFGEKAMRWLPFLGFLPGVGA